MIRLNYCGQKDIYALMEGADVRNQTMITGLRYLRCCHRASWHTPRSLPGTLQPNVLFLQLPWWMISNLGPN